MSSTLPPSAKPVAGWWPSRPSPLSAVSIFISLAILIIHHKILEKNVLSVLFFHVYASRIWNGQQKIFDIRFEYMKNTSASGCLPLDGHTVAIASGATGEWARTKPEHLEVVLSWKPRAARGRTCVSIVRHRTPPYLLKKQTLHTSRLISLWPLDIYFRIIERLTSEIGGKRNSECVCVCLPAGIIV